MGICQGEKERGMKWHDQKDKVWWGNKGGLKRIEGRLREGEGTVD